VGTLISDLKLSFVDINNNILAQKDIPNLKIKIGSKTFILKKEKDKAYHLHNYTITKDLITNNKLVVSVLTPLEGQYTNTKRTYPIDNIKTKITLKNNPKELYKNLTVGEPITLSIEFENLKNQNISNMNCYFNNRNKNPFNCKNDYCTYQLVVPEDLSNIKIYCSFDKETAKGKKNLPLYFDIDTNLSHGINLGSLTNPKDGVIGNPFELCFNLLFANNTPVSDPSLFKMQINNKDVELYKRNNSFCVTNFLIPYTKLDKNIKITFLDNDYNSKISVDLKPGTYWTWFFIVIILIILINIGLIIKASLSKETYDDLLDKRDKYKSKLKELKEKYLQGDINKKEFDSKLNEYSIKMSYLNEKMLHVKKKEKKVKPKEAEVESYKPSQKKAPKELINAIFSDNKKSVKIKDEDLFVADVNNSAVPEEPKFVAPKKPKLVKEKKESKFILFFKNLFKKKPKKPKEQKKSETETQENTNFNFQQDQDLSFEPEPLTNNDNFDIRSWQK